MEPDFDAMSLGEMLQFRIDNQVVIPEIGDLLAADVLRIREREKELNGPLPGDEIVIVPVGKNTTTVATKHFEEQFRAILKDAYLTPKSVQGFKVLREDINAMSLQELVKFNAYRNLVGGEQLTALYEPEIERRRNGAPMTHHIQRDCCTMGFTEEYLGEFRNAVLAAVDQKEKDFLNEPAS